MKLRWWTRLALVSAIAGFVASGPPPGFEHPDFESHATLLNDVAAPPIAIKTFETTELATTELATTEIVSDSSQASDLISPQVEDDQAPATAP
jgi:hypothetical protein